MKPEVLKSLLIARLLFDEAQSLCRVSDKYTASAGLVVLQDAVELVLLSVLIEIGVDEMKTIDKISFDELIGELKKNGYCIIKSSTIKAMNKQRVIIKHYGQAAEPETVKNYYDASIKVVNDLLTRIFNTDLHGISIHEILKNGELKEHIREACDRIEKKEYYAALVEIRKAIYLEIEQQYSIFDWRDFPNSQRLGILDIIRRGGLKAPINKKNKEWIDENVNDPFGYIQIDHESLRLDLLEWGVSTQDFWNLWRLTPKVFYNPITKIWRYDINIQHFNEIANEENCRFCLDRAVSILVKKQEHFDLIRKIEGGLEQKLVIKLKSNQSVYKKSSLNSFVIGILDTGDTFKADGIVPSIDGTEDFYKLSYVNKPPANQGYVLYNECTLEEIKNE